MQKHAPKNLPEGFRDIWKEIAEADEAATSRQILSRELGISTHTIQRILVDGDVPDFTIPVSKRILHSWSRIITRLALYFGHDPFEWVKMVKIDPIDGIPEVINTEISRKTETVSTTEDGSTRNIIQATHPDSDSSFFENLGRKMLNSVVPELKARNLLKDELMKSIETALEKSEPVRTKTDCEDLTEKKYCLSCLAPLNDERNAGVSDTYCRYCSDENGNLLPREEVLVVIAEWFVNWQKDLTVSEARRRADLYMRSMPAWNKVT